MQLTNVKITVAAMYIAVVGAAGVAAGVTAPAVWVALVALALLPALAMLTLWNDPSPTLSEVSVQLPGR